MRCGPPVSHTPSFKRFNNDGQNQHRLQPSEPPAFPFLHNLAAPPSALEPCPGYETTLPSRRRNWLKPMALDRLLAPPPRPEPEAPCQEFHHQGPCDLYAKKTPPLAGGRPTFLITRQPVPGRKPVGAGRTPASWSRLRADYSIGWRRCSWCPWNASSIRHRANQDALSCCS